MISEFAGRTRFCYNYQYMNQEFEHMELEKDIERLAAEVRGKGGTTPETQREAVKQTVAREIYPAGETTVSKPAETSAPSPILPNYLQNADQEVRLKVEQLVDLAWHKGIRTAVKEAEKSGSFFVDALHDALTDKLYNEFKNRGLL